MLGISEDLKKGDCIICCAVSIIAGETELILMMIEQQDHRQL